MIISISGRKGSGKTVLRSGCEKFGFVKISWADRLKEIVSQLFDWSIDSLNDPLLKEDRFARPVVFDEVKGAALAALINADEPLFEETTWFWSRREALQYVGTDLLRKYDTNFHVNSLINKIDPKKNYVLDDTRFQNELMALKELDAHCLYVVRPYNFQYSNHRSEIDLRRHDFNCVIINDDTVEALLEKMALLIEEFSFVRLHKDKSSTNDVFLHINDQTAYWAGYLAKAGRVWKSDKEYCLTVCSHNDMCHRFRDFLGVETPIITRLGSPWSEMTVESKLLIDDLKLWEISPDKEETIPIPIIKDLALREAWQRGFNDWFH